MSPSRALVLALRFLCVCTVGGDTTGGDSSTDGTDANGEAVVLKILDTEYAIEDYAICIAKENDELLEQINAALAELEEEGVLSAIVDKYISDIPHELSFQQDAAGKAPLVMVTNAAFPPYEFYDGADIVGIDAEIAAAIADKLDRQLVIDDIDFDAIVISVSTGKADFGMAGMTVTEDRLQNINFSTSYATGVQSVIVKGDSSIETVDDLFSTQTTYIVGVQRGTTGDIYARGDFGDERVIQYTTGADAVQALLTGKVDCVIIDNEPAKAYVAANNG